MIKNVVIRTDKVIGTPNPKMWGIFYEEINHAGDGGLYAELIKNRSFADARLPEATVFSNGQIHTKKGFEMPFDQSDMLPGWTLKRSEAAIAYMELTRENPRNSECAEQLMLSVMKPGAGVKLVNEGYWGIPVKKQGYYGYCILRGEGIGSVKVGLMHSNGVEYCSQVLEMGTSFEKVEFELDCPAENANARFFMEVKECGTLYVDFVTLFPDDTDQHRPFGFRKDLMDMLRGLNPGFVRFPGGCVVEGINLENAIHWKKTRGPVEDRPGHWDLWGYRATDGLGMLEFCQLAEDLDADIMYVVNCGMSCQFRKSELADEAGIDYWLENALDGIEYIYGDITTKYGALRAADGHPEPFSLKYVEIGNENWGEDYHVRYRKFYTAIKERYPELILIANEQIPDAPMDMVDDHYYTMPQTFPQMYQKYEGSGVSVYVGEYACNQQVGYGNLLGAVSEAAFMIRMENRCDRIRIASYAPLFCNDNNRAWPVNLINYDGSHVFGIPSYEIQKLFGNCRVKQVYETDCAVVEGADSSLYVTAGQAIAAEEGELVIKAANFGTQSIDAVFTVDGKVLSGQKLLLVASEKETDTNSLLYPDLVSTTEAAFAQEGDKVIVTLPPYSFAVLTGTVLDA